MQFLLTLLIQGLPQLRQGKQSQVPLPSAAHGFGSLTKRCSAHTWPPSAQPWPIKGFIELIQMPGLSWGNRVCVTDDKGSQWTPLPTTPGWWGSAALEKKPSRHPRAQSCQLNMSWIQEQCHLASGRRDDGKKGESLSVPFAFGNRFKFYIFQYNYWQQELKSHTTDISWKISYISQDMV